MKINGGEFLIKFDKILILGRFQKILDIVGEALEVLERRRRHGGCLGYDLDDKNDHGIVTFAYKSQRREKPDFCGTFWWICSVLWMMMTVVRGSKVAPDTVQAIEKTQGVDLD